MIESKVNNPIRAQLYGYIGRGVKDAAVNESGHLILTMTDGKTIDVGDVTGAPGLTPYIKDGYWWIGDENTGVPAMGSGGGGGGMIYQGSDSIRINGNVISVITANNVEEDNTLPVTSAAVYVEIGNIDTLLQTI